MITIINTLPDQTETRNPVHMLAQTDAFLSAAGSLGTFIVNFTAQPVATNYFYLYVAGVAIKFTGVAASPNYANNEWTVPNLANAGEWLVFVNEITANYYVDKYFTVTDDFLTATLTLTEKIAGAASLLSTETVSANVNLTITPGVADTYASGYKNSLHIHRQTDDTATPEDDLVAIVETIPEIDQTFSIECSHALAALVIANPPTLDDTPIEPCHDMAAWYNARLLEQYGSTVLVRSFQVIGSANAYPRAFFGGTRRRYYDIPAWEYEANYLQATVNKWLTYMPSSIQVLTSQPMYLYYYLKDTDTTANLVYNITYTDGTTATGTVHSSILGSHNGRIIRIQTGWDQLDLGSLNPSKTPSFFTIHLTNHASTTISPVQTYYINHHPTAGSLYIYWQNPLGGYDTLLASGYELRKARTISQADKFVYPTDYSQGPYANSHKEKFYQLTLRTGPLTQAEADWMQDILHSPHILFYNTTLQRLESLTIDTNELPTWDDMQNINAFEIDFSLARTE